MHRTKGTGPCPSHARRELAGGGATCPWYAACAMARGLRLAVVGLVLLAMVGRRVSV